MYLQYTLAKKRTVAAPSCKPERRQRAKQPSSERRSQSDERKNCMLRYQIGCSPGGGGGHSTSQLDRGVPLGGGGVKT